MWPWLIVLGVGGMVFALELATRRDEVVAILSGVSEHGVRGTCGRYLEGLALYSSGYWSGTCLSAWSMARLLGDSPRNRHWVALVTGVLLASICAIGTGVALLTFRDKMI